MASPLDPVGFLRATPPFDKLDQAAFDGAARQLEITFHPAGTRLVHRGDPPMEHLLVLRKGSVRLERDGASVQLLEEGELLGLSSFLSRTTPVDAVVEEDLLAYRLPRAAVEPLLTQPGFAAQLAAGLAQRLQHGMESPLAPFQADLAAPVSSLLRRPAVRISPQATVGEAARRMREHGISSLLVDGDPPGILTDRDLRSRVLAEGRGPEVKVIEVRSAPLRTVEADLPVHAAWATLLEAGVHHLPVVRGGEVLGMITSTDLLKHTAHGPVSVLRWVERVVSRDQLGGYSARVAEMASSLLAGGLDGTVVAGFVARLNDALLGRILRWAQADLGGAPAAWAWLALGSEGRGEQTLVTDQDSALAWADGAPAGAEEWFGRFAARAVDDLGTAGFPPCPGGTTAVRWHGPLSWWDELYQRWTTTIETRPLMEAAIFLDFRRVAGALPLDRLEARLRAARSHWPFLRSLARSALQFQPPGALQLRLRGSGSRVDLKKHGLMPLTALARCHALETGSTVRGTLDRLAAARAAGLLDADAEAMLAEAFRFLLRLRLREQLRRRAAGAADGDEVALSQLSAVERRVLKDSLAALREWQEQTAYHYRIGL